MPHGCLLYYITDRTQLPGSESERRHALLAKIAEAVACGVDYIQLREKDMSTRELEGLAREAVAVVRHNDQLRTENGELRTDSRTTNDERRTARLLINSRTDAALAVGADGVHLRSDDVSPTDVRRVLERCPADRPLTTDHFLIAVSCHTPAEVLRAASDDADFVVFAPVFGKKYPPRSAPTGVDMLREACQAAIPVLALGGVTLENAASCLQAGAAGIAGIRLFQENKIAEVVRRLRSP